MNKLRLTGLLLTRLLGLLLMYVSCVQVGYAQQSGGGNYPTGNGVRVKEVDGSPNVPGTQTLVFPNGSLTRAGQTVTVTIAGGTTINSTNGQVPYRVNSTTFGDSAFASNALNSTYLQATSGASGAGLTLTVAGGGTNENLFLVPKGLGTVSLIGTGTTTQVIGSSTGLSGMYMRAYSSADNTAPILFVRFETGSEQVRIDNSTGNVGIATGSDTTGAQLSVYSQSTTRPSLKLRALSGTSGTQETLGVYDATGTLKFAIAAQGTLSGTSNGLGFGSVELQTTSYLNVAGNILGVGNTVTTSFLIDGVSSNSIVLASDSALAWSSSAANAVSAGTLRTNRDTFLYRDVANTLAQRNGTNAQRYNLANTYTSGSVREDLSFYWSSNVAHIGATTTGATARVLQLDFGGTTTAAISIPITSGAVTFSDGGVALGKTITAGGTTGDQTINKSSFTVNFAAAATAITVTNSLVTANSNIICTVQTNDTTMKSVAAVPGSGSVVLTANAAATAETRVGCVIHN